MHMSRYWIFVRPNKRHLRPIAGQRLRRFLLILSTALFFGNAAHAAQWARTYGGASDDRANSVQPTSDGGFVVAGRTSSFGAGSADAWVLKLDASGNVIWQKTYGGTATDEAADIKPTA